MDKVGAFTVPVIICFIIIFGLVRRVDVFDEFKKGFVDGIYSLWSVVPSIAGLVIGVNMLSASGFFDTISFLLSPVCELIGIPSQVIPLGLIRPVSGSGATAVLSSILETYGADSLIGKTASVMAGSTETTFYTIAVYFGAAGIRKTRHTIPAALCADIAGIAGACIITSFLC